MKRLAVFASALFAISAHAAPVLMISIDGLRPDYVTQADQHGLKIPNLRRFVEQGTFAQGVTGVVPTVTYPSHTTLVTGVWPAEHGIYDNLIFDPLNIDYDAWYWYAPDNKSETLWQAADRKGIVTASVNWPVTVNAHGIRYNVAEFWRVNTDEDQKLMEAIAQPPGLLGNLSKELGPYVPGLREGIPADETRTRFARKILHDFKPGFMTVHIIDLDGESHGHGPFSAEANDALEHLDSMIGELRDAALANDPKTVVVVVSDHGFSRTDYKFNWRSAFVNAGLISLKPMRADGSRVEVASWKAQLWVAGGSAALMLNDPNDKASATQARTLLEGLKSDPHNGIARLIEPDEAKALGGWPNAALLVELDPDFQFGTAWSGPVIAAAPSTGSHGYLPSRPEMRASFFALGKGIAAKRDLGVIDMRQIAPTVAHLLGVELPGAKQPALDVATH